jgi:threonine/homoserine/homoserine lactone efflux protein
LLHGGEITGICMSAQALFFSGSWQSVLTLVLEAAVVMGSPGPSTMAVMATATAFGVSQSLGFVSGAIAGTAAVLSAVATGVVALLISVPWLGPGLTIASSLYVLYLAWRIATAAPPSKRADGAVAPSFASGFLLAIANPKAWFAIAAVFTGATLIGSSRELDALLKAVVLAGMIVIIHFAWLVAGSSLAGLLRDPLRARMANVLFGLILVATIALPLMR